MTSAIEECAEALLRGESDDAFRLMMQAVATAGASYGNAVDRRAGLAVVRRIIEAAIRKGGPVDELEDMFADFAAVVGKLPTARLN